MNQQKLLPGTIGLMLALLFLAACGMPSTIPTQMPLPTATVEIAVVEELAQAFISTYESDKPRIIWLFSLTRPST